MPVGVKDTDRIFARSPYYINCVPSSGKTIQSASLTVKIQTGQRSTLASPAMTTVKQYDLSKSNAIDVQCADCNFTYNYVHDYSFGSVLGTDTCTGNNLFEGNHIYKVTRNTNDPYYPYNEPDPHPGSGFAVRSSYLTIRKNIFHYLQLPQAIMFYGGRGAYHDIIFENNLLGS